MHEVNFKTHLRLVRFTLQDYDSSNILLHDNNSESKTIPTIYILLVKLNWENLIIEKFKNN